MPAGTHLCTIYSGPAERDRVRFAFRWEGRLRGDRCLWLVDHLEAARVLELTSRRLSAGDSGDSRYPHVHRASDVCLQAGRFSVDRTTSFLADSAVHSAEAGFPLLRVIVEMGWLLRQPQAMDDLLLYESAVDEVVEQASAVVMCVYDLQCLGVEMLVEVLTTHESVLLDGTVLVNPHYRVGAGHVAATETGGAQPRPAGAEGRRQQATASDPWEALTESERRIAAHVVAGLTNREIATLLAVSRHTVDAHLKHIYVKLGIHTRVELTVLALQHPVEG
ncbi:MAG: MEDS domain-containing protein [Mycobacteriaceae bacterium]